MQPVKTQHLIHLTGLALAILTLNPQLSTCLAQGSLTPPGAPAPTMKTLDQIDAKLEKRTPIVALPFTITNAGSFYLTTNLTGMPGQTGITVNANDVSIDLNGFALIGGGGGSKGVYVGESVIQTNFWIGNGTLRDWDGGGVFAPHYNARVENLRLSHNGGTGAIYLGSGAEVSGCSARANPARGIVVGTAGSIAKCKAEQNSADGIVAGESSIVMDCVAYSNGGDGIIVGNASTALNCVASRNSTNGITSGDGCVTLNCATYLNGGAGIVTRDNSSVKGCVSQHNTGSGIRCGANTMVSECNAVRNADGIFIGHNCLIVGNLVNANYGAGIRNNTNSSNSRIDGNTAYGNFGTGVILYNSLVIRNIVAGSITNYFGTGNNMGPIDNASTSTHPWANF